jgi:hypothetical protein
MPCPHCGQTALEFCPKCDEHYFQTRVTIHNDSAIAALKERKELTDKHNAELKKSKAEAAKWRFRIKVVVVVSVFVSLSVVCRIILHEMCCPTPPTQEEPPVIRIALCDPGKQFEVDGYIAVNFSIEERRNVIVNVSAECLYCPYASLTIYLFDEDNYRKFEAHEPYNRIDSVDADSYCYIGPLDKGGYYVVLQNTSDTDGIVVKVINASLIYKQENSSH